MIVICLGLAGFFFRSPLHARDLYKSKDGNYSFALDGYYKNFLSVSHYYEHPLIQQPTEAIDIQRLRLKIKANLSPYVEIHVHHEVIPQVQSMGSSQSFGAFAGLELKEDYPNRLFTIPTVTSGNFKLANDLDRLFIVLVLPHVDIFLGRQAVSWGTALVWNPTDLFTPFSPFAIDKEQKQGVDAVRLTFEIGDLTALDMVYVASKKPEKMSGGARFSTSFDVVDLSWMAGYFRQDWVFGMDLATDLFGMGLRLEGTHTIAHKGRDFARVSVSLDYRFDFGLYILGEYAYNGFGTMDPSRYAEYLFDPVKSARLLQGEITVLGMHHLALMLDWEIHPLLHGQLMTVMNLSDPSAVLGPSLIYDIITDVQVLAGAYLAIGKRPEKTLDPSALRSEFGTYPHTFFAAMKIYF
jgi:hypothetical protein